MAKPDRDLARKVRKALREEIRLLKAELRKWSNIR